jgi:hypothetical protein
MREDKDQGEHQSKICHQFFMVCNHNESSGMANDHASAGYPFAHLDLPLGTTLDQIWISKGEMLVEVVHVLLLLLLKNKLKGISVGWCG